MEPARDELELELVELGELVSALDEREPRLAGFFEGADEVVLARAPGRLDVLGGIADYSGSLVLEMPLHEAARVAVASTADDVVRVVSRGDELRQVALPARELAEACASLAGARAYFALLPAAERWVAYALGVLAVLRVEHGVELEGGLRLLVDSRVPQGKGVGSSAALEVAAMRACAALWQVSLSGVELGLSCQRVENQVVGAPCGVMDQVTSACGERGRLLSILCQPATLCGSIALPEGLAVFGIDSGLRHAVSGTDYGQVRVAAFMGYCILARQLGARVVPVAPGRVVLEGDPLGGYLANLRPDQLTSQLEAALPERLKGADFLASHGGISDAATSVDPACDYMVRAATRHPIFEHQRVRELSARLPSAATTAECSQLGELLQASHDSYSACGLGSSGTDLLAEQVRRAGPAQGLFGAKITGGGSGGTVAVLARSDALGRVRQLAEAYTAQTGRAAQVFARSSAGAMASAPLRRKLASRRKPNG